jgi:hypothetical protein
VSALPTGAKGFNMYRSAAITCRTSVAGTETLTFTFTDISNTVQTYTASGNCTSLGGSSAGSIMQTFRAKASTAIQLSTGHTGSQPTYDLGVAVYQLHTK